jgi:hypothetical protein
MDRIMIDLRNENECSQIRKIFTNKDLVSVEDLLDMICELDDRVSDLTDEIRDIKQDLEDNYKRISIEDQVGISERDFI